MSVQHPNRVKVHSEILYKRSYATCRNKVVLRRNLLTQLLDECIYLRTVLGNIRALRTHVFLECSPHISVMVVKGRIAVPWKPQIAPVACIAP